MKQSKVVRVGRIGFAIVALAWIVFSAWQLSASYTEQRVGAQLQMEAAKSRQSRALQSCGQYRPANLVDCVDRQISAAREDQRDEQALYAQQQASDWAFWTMAIAGLGLVLTAWALWYVRGTLAATRKAAEEATSATMEMVRSNRIAEEAHRPWITIEPRIYDFYCDEKMFGFTFMVAFKNIGLSVAEGFRANFSIMPSGEDYVTAAGKMANEIFNEMVAFPRILMPGDEHIVTMKNNWVLDDMPWWGEPERIYFTLFAHTNYRLPGTILSGNRQDQKATICTYLIGLKAHDVVRQMWLHRNDLYHATADDFGFRKTSPNRAK